MDKQEIREVLNHGFGTQNFPMKRPGKNSFDQCPEKFDEARFKAWATPELLQRLESLQKVTPELDWR